jgi:hypothetical protein
VPGGRLHGHGQQRQLNLLDHARLDGSGGVGSVRVEGLGGPGRRR